MAEVPISERLARYGLSEQQVRLTDLKVAADEEVTISRQNPFLADRAIQLHPESIADVKRWMGLPDHAFGEGARTAPDVALLPPAVISSSLGENLTIDEHRTMNSLAGTFVFGHSGAVAEVHVPAMNAWLAAIKARINIFAFLDIYVAAGAQLTLAPSVHVLFARYVTVEHTGRIVLGPGSTTSIDCAGFRGYVPQYVPLVAAAEQMVARRIKS